MRLTPVEPFQRLKKTIEMVSLLSDKSFHLAEARC
jgi:hypothetical protein